MLPSIGISFSDTIGLAIAAPDKNDSLTTKHIESELSRDEPELATTTATFQVDIPDLL